MRFTFNSFSPAAGRTEHDLLPTRTCVAHGCYGRVRRTAAQLTFVFTVFAGLLVHRRRRRPCAGARPLHVRCARARVRWRSSVGRMSFDTRPGAREPPNHGDRLCLVVGGGTCVYPDRGEGPWSVAYLGCPPRNGGGALVLISNSSLARAVLRLNYKNTAA